MGSTSSAMTTKEAFLASIRATQWFNPYLAKRGFLESLVVDFSPSAVLDSASLRRRAFFSCLDSGLYLFKSWKSWVAVFLSKVLPNWAIAGGT